MRKRQASGTAVLVAAARVAASKLPSAAVDPHDDLSAVVLSPPLRLAVALLAASERASSRGTRWLLDAGGGIVHHVALRSVMIDRFVTDALAAGMRQLVIVGAGLDLRAHRLAFPGDTHVFEVDHPATQRKKRTRVARAGLSDGDIRYVATDLATADLKTALERAGHDPNAPTIWVWEGVLPYLRREHAERTLRAMAERSAPGSRLVASYVASRREWTRASRLAGPLLLLILGEPLGDSYPPDEFRSLVAACGWTSLDDSAPEAWFQAVGRGRTPCLSEYERLHLATRPALLVDL